MQMALADRALAGGHEPRQPLSFSQIEFEPRAVLMRSIIAEALIPHQSQLQILVAQNEGQLTAIEVFFEPDFVLWAPAVDLPMPAFAIVGFIQAANQISLDAPG